MNDVNIKKKRTKNFGIIILILAILFSLVSCRVNDSPQDSHKLGDTGVSVYTEMIKVDLEYGSETLGFPLYFVSDSPLSMEDIAFVRLEGENVEYFESTELSILNITDVTDVKINGKYLYLYDVVSEIDGDYFTPMANIEAPEVWEIRIDNVVVSIDGAEYSIKLEHPVKYHYNDENYNDIEGNHMYGPITVFTYGIAETYSVNIHNYAGDVTLTDFYFSNFLNANNKVVYCNGEQLGDLDGKANYKVGKRESGAAFGATIYFNPAHSEKYTYTEFDYILCTAIVDYYVEGDNTVYRMKFPFNSQGIGNRETAENFLEYVANLD